MSTETRTDKPQTATKRRSWKRWLLRCTLVIGVLILSLFGWGYWRFASSLPQLSGTISSPHITSEVRIDRDAQGVPSIHSESRTDTAYALGLVHAQDRFFQMDLLRRMSGGRLGELVGPMALRSDRNFRRHRFEPLAAAVYEKLPADKKSIVDAYAQGVNAGLLGLKDVPFEYILLRQSPQTWKPTDSILVMMTMLCDLQPMDGRIELGLGELQEKVPPEVFQFLVRTGSHWDAALDGSELPKPSIPAPAVFSVRGTTLGHAPMQYAKRTAPADESPRLRPFEELRFADIHFSDVSFTGHSSADLVDPDFVIGSNNWAVGSQVGRDAKAILASDMHLGLQVPTIWYRALMHGPTIATGANADSGRDNSITEEPKRRVVGVTLPGTPVLIEGSNGSVAWGFTNSYGDYGDIVELKLTDTQDKNEYLTANGKRNLIEYKEELKYPGGSEELVYYWSEWGPVVDQRDGRKFVHCWVGNDPNAFDLNLLELESANSTEEALSIANRSGMPNQNVTIVDAAGNIGWTLSGRIPKRSGKPALTPVDWSEGENMWQGYLEPSEYPRVYNPANGRIWTANNRILGEDYLDKVGDGRFDPGARARQIRDRLFEKEIHSEQDLLNIQLDDEARFMSQWKARLLEVADKNSNKLSAALLKHVNASSSHASVDAVGYRIVAEFRVQVLLRIFGMEIGRGRTPTDSQGSGLAKKIGLTRSVALSRDAVADQLLAEKPLHWLPTEYADWNALLLEAAVKCEEVLSQPAGLDQATWGKRNQAQIRHPLSSALAQLSPLLDMPELPLPGDNHMPRVQSPAGGASQRMVVSPGEEEKGIYHQPGGQSGHPLSPYYRLGYEDWVYGKASPLLPGPAEHQLRLIPTSQR